MDREREREREARESEREKERERERGRELCDSLVASPRTADVIRLSRMIPPAP